MNTNLTNQRLFGVGRVVVITLLLIFPAAAVGFPKQDVVDKDLDELLLYVVSRKKAPPIELVKVLLKKGARVNQSVRYKTPLMYAAGEGHIEIARLLLAKGADFNALTDEGTPLMMAVQEGHAEMVQLLLKARANVNAKDRLERTALMMAARRSNADVMRLLLAAGADTNVVERWGHTALMEADSAEYVRLLTASGAQLNAKDSEGKTALMHAVRRGDVQVVEALLQAGVDTTVRDAKGDTALMHALEQVRSYGPEEAKRITKLRIQSAPLLLRADSGDVNAQNENGETLLMRAVRLGETEIVKTLLARGADVNVTDVFGESAAVIAYENDFVTIQELLKGAAPASQTLNAFLVAAIGKKDRQKVEEVLAAGADANYEYAIGYEHRSIKSTVLILAVNAGDAAIVQMLLSAGANVNAKGLLHGSEHGLKYGTALEAAESSKNAELISLLRTR